ncbi:MAG: DUF1579 domain-containing protein [Candidatus Krumholzibacteriia bacterium]
MKSLRLFSTLAAVVIAAGLAVNVSHAGKDKDKKEAGHSHEYSAEQMAAYQEAISPGSHHKQLKNLVGKWNAKIMMWERPGAEATVSEGTAAAEMILGGRFVMSHMSSEMMGMPFKGVGMVGYDKVTKKHTSLWLDNMGTQMLYTEGDCENHCKTETHYATVTGPLGNQMKVRFVNNIIDENKHTFEWYVIGDGGNEFKQMEIVYTRS